MRDDITAIIKVLGINGAALATVTLADFEALLKVLLLFASLVYTCAKIFLLIKPKKKARPMKSITKFAAFMLLTMLTLAVGCANAGYGRKTTSDLATDKAGNAAYETTKRTVSKPVLIADQLAYETETLETSKPVLAEAERVRGGTKRLLASGELIQLEAGGNATNRFVKVGSLKDKPEPDAIAAAGTATGNVIGAAVNAAVSGGTGTAVEAAKDTGTSVVDKAKEILKE